jgi:hypothetical protein
MMAHSHPSNLMDMVPEMRISCRKFLLFAIASASATVTEAQSKVPLVFEQTGVFESERLSESSGIAVSRVHAGILWTHNDSGDDPVVYAVDITGKDHGSFRVEGAGAVDWEDIALAGCPASVGSGDCLFIGDTGDNEEQRDSVAIYVVPEPNPEVVPPGRTAVAGAAKVLWLRYREGPQDVEALAVAPDGTLLLITKVRNRPADIYWIQPSFSVGGRAKTVVVSDSLPIQQRLDRMVTAAAISRNGRLLVVRTYAELFAFEIGNDGDRKLSPLGPPCWLGMQQIQGESVDFLDEEWVVLTSEAIFGRRGTLARAKCGTDVTTPR